MHLTLPWKEPSRSDIGEEEVGDKMDCDNEKYCNKTDAMDAVPMQKSNNPRI